MDELELLKKDWQTSSINFKEFNKEELYKLIYKHLLFNKCSTG